MCRGSAPNTAHLPNTAHRYISSGMCWNLAATIQTSCSVDAIRRVEVLDETSAFCVFSYFTSNFPKFKICVSDTCACYFQVKGTLYLTCYYTNNFLLLCSLCSSSCFVIIDHSSQIRARHIFLSQCAKIRLPKVVIIPHCTILGTLKICWKKWQTDRARRGSLLHNAGFGATNSAQEQIDDYKHLFENPVWVVRQKVL